MCPKSLWSFIAKMKILSQVGLQSGRAAFVKWDLGMSVCVLSCVCVFLSRLGSSCVRCLLHPRSARRNSWRKGMRRKQPWRNLPELWDLGSLGNWRCLGGEMHRSTPTLWACDGSLLVSACILCQPNQVQGRNMASRACGARRFFFFLIIIYFIEVFWPAHRPPYFPGGFFTGAFLMSFSILKLDLFCVFNFIFLLCLLQLPVPEH